MDDEMAGANSQKPIALDPVSIAIKVYDYQWAATFGLTPEDAAAELATDGVDTVLVCNQIDPLPTSGVDQEGYLAGGLSPTVATDRAFSDALRAAGMRVYQTTALFFDPGLLASFPNARPVDANGELDRGFDWYHGVCPTHDDFLEAKIERLRRVAEALAPDGFFLSFTRFPGFWENWVPGFVFGNADRFCFCDRCRARFADDMKIALPPGGVADQARVILEGYAAEWTVWRTARIVDAIARISGEVRAVVPDASVMLNTLPFPASEFGGLDVRREIAAQDLATLRGVVDRFELMTYLQILDRPDSWLGPVVANARQDTPDRPLLCTLQVAPLYAAGIHAGRGRAEAISAGDLDRTARAALAAGADGLVFYHWTDFLVDEAEGGSKRQVLRGLKDD
jgi:hypothetical protein